MPPTERAKLRVVRIAKKRVSKLLDIHGDSLLLDWLETKPDLQVFEGSSFFDESRREFMEHGPEKMNIGSTITGEKVGRLPATLGIEAMAQAAATALMLHAEQNNVPLISRLTCTIQRAIFPGRLTIEGKILGIRGSFAEVDVRCLQSSLDVITARLLFGRVIS